MAKDKKERKNFEREIEVAISKELERYAEANADFLQMHSDLSNLNPNRGGRKGHGGFVFERVEKAKRNAASHIKGGTKVVELTDTLAEKGNPNFSVNDTNSDLVSLNKDGSVVVDSGEQLKAYGTKTTKSAVRDVMNGKEGNINRYDTITVPENRYKPTLKEIDNYIEKAKNEGNEKGVEELKKLKKKIKKGTADTKDIIYSYLFSNSPINLLELLPHLLSRLRFNGIYISYSAFKPLFAVGHKWSCAMEMSSAAKLLAEVNMPHDVALVSPWYSDMIINQQTCNHLSVALMKQFRLLFVQMKALDIHDFPYKIDGRQ